MSEESVVMVLGAGGGQQWSREGLRGEHTVASSSCEGWRAREAASQAPAPGPLMFLFSKIAQRLFVASGC